MGEIVTIAGHVCVSLECRCIAQWHLRSWRETPQVQCLAARAWRQRRPIIEALPRRISEAGFSPSTDRGSASMKLTTFVGAAASGCRSIGMPACLNISSRA